MLVASTHAAEGDSRITADVRAIRSEIQNAQRAFTRVRDSKGSDTREFDVAIMRLRLGINALSASLKSEKQVSGATSRGGRRQSRSNVCLLQVAGKGACPVGLARGRARSGSPRLICKRTSFSCSQDPRGTGRCIPHSAKTTRDRTRWFARCYRYTRAKAGIQAAHGHSLQAPIACPAWSGSEGAR